MFHTSSSIHSLHFRTSIRIFISFQLFLLQLLTMNNESILSLIPFISFDSHHKYFRKNLKEVKMSSIHKKQTGTFKKLSKGKISHMFKVFDKIMFCNARDEKRTQYESVETSAVCNAKTLPSHLYKSRQLLAIVKFKSISQPSSYSCQVKSSNLLSCPGSQSKNLCQNYIYSMALVQAAIW
jgi:hypothetical protein